MGGIKGLLKSTIRDYHRRVRSHSAFNALTLSRLLALLLRPRKESKGLVGKFFAGSIGGSEK